MKHDDLIRRQQHLLARSAALRESLSMDAQGLKRPLALVDTAHQSVLWLARHPQWPMAAIAALVILRPRRALSWAGRVWWAWKTAQRFQKLI